MTDGILRLSHAEVRVPDLQLALAYYAEVGVTHLNIEPRGENPLEVIEKVKAWSE